MKLTSVLVYAATVCSVSVQAQNNYQLSKELHTKTSGSWVGDDVYHDANGNGKRDKGEDGFKKVTVALYEESKGIVATTITNANGKYYFNKLSGGDYTVEVTDDHDMLCAGGELISKPSQPTYMDGKSENDDIDFGYKCPVTPRPTPTPTCEHPTPQPTPKPDDSCIGDTVYITNGKCAPEKGEGVPDVRVCLFKNGKKVDCMTTNDKGKYTWCGLGKGDYKVKVDQDDVDKNGCDGGSSKLKCEPDQPTKLNGSNKDLDVDFGYKCDTYTIGDTVWQDTNGNGVQDPGEPGIPGIELELYKSGKKVGTVTTNEDGLYYFDGLAVGTYEVVVVNPPAGWTLTGEPYQPVEISDSDNLDIDFGYQPPCCPPHKPTPQGKKGKKGKKGYDFRELKNADKPEICRPCPCCPCPEGKKGKKGYDFRELKNGSKECVDCPCGKRGKRD